MPYSANIPEVTLTLRAEDDDIGTRTIVLNSHCWSVQIGRGSQTEEHLRPQFNNAWFGSRVMSRAHADITVDPVTREVVLTDIGSMHGTYIDGRRLQPHEQVVIVQGKVITFGADILRGELTYQALQLKISHQWSDEYAARMQHWQDGLKAPSLILDESRSTCRGSSYPTTKNSYSLDYSDDEPMSDHEVEVIYESAVQRDCTKPVAVSKLRDDFSVSSSGSAEQRDESAPTSPAEEHTMHKVKVQSSQPDATDIIVIEEPQSDMEVVEEPQSSTQQSSRQDQVYQPQEDPSDSARVHAETIDLLSEMSSSDDEDEGYAELENFSELESEQDWSNRNNTSINTPNSREPQDKSIGQNRAASPSDAALPKYSTCSTSRLAIESERYRGLPEIHAPLSTPSSLPMSCYGNDQNMTFNTTSNCVLNRLPSIQSAPWWDQGLDFSVPSAYRFAPAAFGNQVHPLPPNPAKVSINSILDEEPPHTAIGNKRKREVGDTDQVERVKEKGTAVTGDASDPSMATTATTSCAQAAEARNLKTVSDSTSSVECAPFISVKESQEVQHLTYEAAMPIGSMRDSNDHETQALSNCDAESERPRKRVRVQESATPNSSTGKTIVKYAATALVGAAIGSIGTVFGLAALPADYFL